MKRIIISIIIISLFTKNFAKDLSIGINIPSLALMGLSMNGDFHLKDKWSFNLGLSLRPRYHITPNADSSIYANLKGFAFTPEFRYYLRGINESSFFIGPYFRYQKFSTGQFYFGEDSWSGLSSTLYQGYSQKEVGLGVDIGKRFIINNFSIDFFIGLRVSRHMFEFRYYHHPNETRDSEEFTYEEAYGGSIPGINKVYYESTYYYDKINIPATLPGLRIGLTFNYFIHSQKYNSPNGQDKQIYKNEEY